ncbi:MAG: substrate-binding domain-containing protein, partial [Candidatus Micrarchaeota archaeon]
MAKRIYFLVLFCFAVLLCGCTRDEDRLKITGSDTMVILGQAWAEQYMELDQNKTVSVPGGGAGVGITAVTDGGVDIAQSSREMKQAEIEKATANGVNPVKTEVAYDGIAIIVNPSNVIEQLTVEQVGKIFTGEVRNWEDVGGADGQIGIYSRESS